ncbi:hypothetical protein EW026_g4380 [Hermanssonia centrifuga]|uniref:Carbohydrate kinase PfkB domain-containing protein n=1 Tax=Hermanssonia centrifuga TaxID=98765 RepID=A0A4S4KH97_9APHY|nr:hypothetical protein EW026_g4380 [Hermanssonia centrifuga]
MLSYKDRCVPAQLPALIRILPSIEILSPNAEEALSLLSVFEPPSKSLIEEACHRFLDIGVGPEGKGTVIIRSGSMGAYIASRTRAGQWVPAFWGAEDARKVVDVTGAGNAFLGGLAAGLHFTGNDVFKAVLYATQGISVAEQNRRKAQTHLQLLLMILQYILDLRREGVKSQSLIDV